MSWPRALINGWIVGAFLIGMHPIQALAGSILRGPANTGDITFQPVSDKEQNLLTAKLGNASVADPLDWPASLYGTYGHSEVCTATLIGPNVLLTAAHCVSNGGRASVTRRRGAGGTGICTRAPQYTADNTADYALCIMSADIAAPLYETILSDPARLRPGLQLVATGYGCTDINNPQIDLRKNKFLDFRTGPVTIDALPTTDPVDNFISTSSDPASAFVCPGDSGSAAFLSSGTNSNGSARRAIVAINVQVHTDTLVSDLSSLSTATASSFIANWMHDNLSHSPHICGFNVDHRLCREIPP